MRDIARRSWPILLGVAYGLLMRIVSGLRPFHGHHFANDVGAMLGVFVIFVPLVIGVIAVAYTPTEDRTLGWSLFGPWIPVLLFTFSTWLLLLEGSICILMALPIFLGMASVGGLLAWVFFKIKGAPKSVVPCVALLPALAGLVEIGHTAPTEETFVTRSVDIQAPPEAVWHSINHIDDINAGELSKTLAFMIGVPYPKGAETVVQGDNRVRESYWQKGVYFEEDIKDWQENRYVRWTYHFTEDSFPPHALDEHVRIGGRHFDLLDTAYLLTPIDNGTRLSISVRYRLSTDFNWYAGAWGRVLMGDTEDTLLKLYKGRSERKDS